jgi:hypothetical protein
MGKPHCWGKMKWILKYPSGMEPEHSVCRCEHGALKCKLLTRQSNKIMQTTKIFIDGKEIETTALHYRNEGVEKG